MAPRGRFERLRGRLRGREDAPPSETEATDDAAAAESATEEVSPAPEERPEVVIAPLNLDEPGERRRESVASRLRALRERRAAGAERTAPPPPGEPGAQEEADPTGEPDSADRPGRLQGFRGRFAAAGTAAAGAAGDARDALGGAGRRAADAWRGIPDVARKRIAAGLIVAAVVALIVFVAVPAAPCGAPGGDECPPPDDAIELVPEDALAYAHADIDPESEQYGQAAELADRLPLLSRLAVSAASRELARTNFDAEVRPWAGGEIALAILPGATRLERVLLIESADDEAARAFADDVLGPRARPRDVGGTEVTTGARGLAAAITGGFLAVGDEDGVTEIVDPGAEAGTLGGSEEVEEILDQLPDERLAYAYLSGQGARALFTDPALSQLAAFVDPGATAGVVASLSVEGEVLALESRSVLDPDRAEASPGFFSALPTFAPELTSVVGEEALAYLGLGEPGTSVEALLDQAAADAPDLLNAAERFERRLAKDSGVEVRDEILPLLGSEAALSVQPRTAEGEAVTPGTIEPSGVPYVSLIADGVDAERARRALAELQKPVADALAASGGARVPGFETAEVGGVDAQSLLVNPDVNLTYAVYEDRLVIATSPVGLEQALSGEAGLDSADAFERVTSGLPEEVSALAYLDLRSLVSLGEEIGLATDPGYAAFASDARALEAATAAVTQEEGAIRTDVRLSVGEPPEPSETPQAVGPGSD